MVYSRMTYDIRRTCHTPIDIYNMCHMSHADICIMCHMSRILPYAVCVTYILPYFVCVTYILTYVVCVSCHTHINSRHRTYA